MPSLARSLHLGRLALGYSTCTRPSTTGGQRLLTTAASSLLAASRRASPSRSSMSSTRTTAAVQFSAGSDEQALTRLLHQQVLASASASGRWALTAGGTGLERGFKFKNFAKTWDFMTAVALQCKLKNHHPEWSNVYNSTYVRWTTHQPRGLSALDVELALICDQLARDFGEVVVKEEREEREAVPAVAGGGSSSSGIDGDTDASMRRLADVVTTSAGGDCCTPSSSSSAAPTKKTG